jgi:hypothetical protein
VLLIWDKMFKLFKKPSKRKDFFSDFMSKERRKARNHRYYLKHKDELIERRREYYFINGK